MSSFDLHDAVRRALLENGFEPDPVSEPQALLPPSERSTPTPRDLRDLPWSSIDNAESLDLDQVEVATSLDDGSIRVIVAIDRKSVV